jgi:hypothetical protein
MRRREFITLPGAKTTWPVAGWAQPLERARILSLLTDSQNAWSSSVTKIASPPRRRDRVRGRGLRPIARVDGTKQAMRLVWLLKLFQAMDLLWYS